MYLDLDVQEQGEWFYFFGSHVDENTGEIVYEEPVKDAKAKIRSMAPFIEQRITGRKKQTEHIHNPKTRSMERISYYPELTTEEMKAEREDTWDYIITGLEGFRDKKTKKEIDCTRENKVKLMRLPVFDRFVARCLQILSASGVQDAEIKNSLTGSSSAMSKPDPE